MRRLCHFSVGLRSDHTKMSGVKMNIPTASPAHQVPQLAKAFDNGIFPAMPKVVKYKEVSKPAKMHKKDGSLSAAGLKWLEVLIAHNHVTGHIAGVYSTTEIIRECLFINPTRPEPTIMEDDPEFDFMEWECSRSQDFMRFLE